METQHLQVAGGLVPGVFRIVIGTADVVQLLHEPFQLREPVRGPVQPEFQLFQVRAHAPPEFHIGHQGNAPVLPHGVFAHMMDLPAVHQQQVFILHLIALSVDVRPEAALQKIADLHIGMPVQRQTGIVIVIEKQLPRDSGVVHLII